MKDFNVGDIVIKYDNKIGVASHDILEGDHVHSHNLKTGLGEILSYTYNKTEDTPVKSLWENTKINAFKRSTGEIGIRNELWIVPLVSCINGVAECIIDEFKKNNDTSHIDNITVWKHPFGCSQLGDDMENTQKFLSALATHPNTGGVLLLGLGCENNTLENFLPFLGTYKESSRIKWLIAQKSSDEIKEGAEILKELSNQMKSDKREECSFFDLKIGLKCGGSDAFSGITANPLFGKFSDSFCKDGGCVMMTEVPEMFGAETILMNRAVSKTVFQDVVQLINEFKEYYIKNDQPIYENPAPGNKEGGITTLEEKSLGNIEKGGKVPVMGVLKYSEKITTDASGLWLIQGPGNDPVSVSNMGVCGAHIVLFSTGRGNPYGSFVPCIKVSTTTELAMAKERWIDFDAGKLLDSDNSDEIVKNFGELIIDIANGKQTNNEKYNSREIGIFKNGVVL